MTLRSLLLRGLAVALLPLSSLHAQFVVKGPELRLNGFVSSVESDTAGNVYLAGSFNEFNGTSGAGMGLLRLTPGGAQHATWDIGFVDGVNDLMVSGNFLYVGGSFTTVRTLSAGRINRPYLMRIHLTGANEGKIDTTWVSVPNAPVSRLETDGTSLFISGSFSGVNGTARNRLAKILTGGADPDALDSTWNPGANNTVEDLAFVSPWLYVSGNFSSAGGMSNNYLLRLSTSGNGAGDSAWTPTINRPVGALEASATHLYFGGDFTVVNGAVHRSLGRFSLAGTTPTFDATWKPDPDGEVSSMALSGSTLYIGGVFTRVANTPRRFMAKVNSGGTGGLDGAFVPEPNGSIEDLKVVAGNVVAGGRFNTTVGSASAGYAMMSGTSGSALPAFAGTITTEGQIYSMQPVSGGMIIGGVFDSVNGVPRTSIAKILSNGTLDPSFNVPLVGFNRLVSDMKLDGSTLYFCGDFLTAGGAPTQHVARVNATTGAVDAGWFTKPLTPILCLETDANYVYIGSAGLRYIEIAPNVPVEVNNLARLSKGGTATVDPNWKPYIAAENGNPAIASVNDMVFSGSNLIIGGHFIFVVNPLDISTPYQRVCVAALTTNTWGQPVSGWGDIYFDAVGDVGTISRLLLHNGALYVAGDFQFVNNNEYYYVAKLNPVTGAQDLAFDVSPLDYDDPYGSFKVSTLAASGSHLYVGGSFTHVFTGIAPNPFEASPYIARVSASSGMLDYSWYPYPDGPVSRMAFEGQNLWTYGTFTEIGGEFVDGPVILTPFSTSYQTWLATYLTSNELADSGYTAPFQDLDGDGDSNLVEAMFNTNPKDPRKSYHAAGTGTSGLPLIVRENIGGQFYLTVEYTRWKASANAGAVATPQFSDNLVSWPRNGVQVGNAVSVSSDRERVKFRDSVANGAKGFGRVQILPQTP
ncbi:delta-60 repeat domain-containing protein [Luteolibacter flavescens]|uniref:Delta-60 repeat domain-containing protein n=1 Tax=Luteolibacter flavescens TaxID=1859460 RepID=A0ABT3FTA5_9BACT|nr:delta-60 repeat domain-containing protein [Luteolibacter flavescens]MCW1886805.1 delta-60 repeat domain-containing protein [Luteolibacter flavescens]